MVTCHTDIVYNFTPPLPLSYTLNTHKQCQRDEATGEGAAWAAKKYRGHWVLPESILREFDHAEKTEQAKQGQKTFNCSYTLPIVIYICSVIFLSSLQHKLPVWKANERNRGEFECTSHRNVTSRDSHLWALSYHMWNWMLLVAFSLKTLRMGRNRLQFEGWEPLANKGMPVIVCQKFYTCSINYDDGRSV